MDTAKFLNSSKFSKAFSIQGVKFRKSPHVIEAIFEEDNQAILMNIKDWRPYLLGNQVAIKIWKLLNKPMRINNLVSKIHCSFNSNRRDIERDAREFILFLLKKNLIVKE